MIGFRVQAFCQKLAVLLGVEVITSEGRIALARLSRCQSFGAYGILRL